MIFLKVTDNEFLNWQDLLNRGGVFRFVFVSLGVYGVLFFFGSGLYILTKPGSWKIALLAAVAAVFNRYVVCELFDYFYPKAHPYQRLNFKLPVAWILFSSMDERHDSFPSEHASTSIAISLVLYYFFPVLGLFGFAVTLLMSLARVVIGYHDVYDIIGGWLFGLLSSSLALSAYIFWIVR